MSRIAMARVFNPSRLLLRAAPHSPVRIASPKRFRPDSYIPAVTRGMAYTFCEKGQANTLDYRVYISKCLFVCCGGTGEAGLVGHSCFVNGFNLASDRIIGWHLWSLWNDDICMQSHEPSRGMTPRPAVTSGKFHD